MWQFFYCAMCHNLGPSLIIIMNNEDQYFEKKNYVKKVHSATCQFLINR